MLNIFVYYFILTTIKREDNIKEDPVVLDRCALSISTRIESYNSSKHCHLRVQDIFGQIINFDTVGI